MKIIYRIDAAGRKNYYKINNFGIESRISKNELTDNQINNARKSTVYNKVQVSRLRGPVKRKSSKRSKSSKRNLSKEESRQIFNKIMDEVELNVEDQIMDNDDITNLEIENIVNEEIDKVISKYLKSKTRNELLQIIEDNILQEDEDISMWQKVTVIGLRGIIRTFVFEEFMRDFIMNHYM